MQPFSAQLTVHSKRKVTLVFQFENSGFCNTLGLVMRPTLSPSTPDLEHLNGMKTTISAPAWFSIEN